MKPVRIEDLFFTTVKYNHDYIRVTAVNTVDDYIGQIDSESRISISGLCTQELMNILKFISIWAINFHKTIPLDDYAKGWIDEK